MFITTVAPLCYGILYFDISSLSSNVFHFIPSFNLSYIYLIAARHSSSLMADWHAIHRAALCTDVTFNDYNLISSQVFQWWYCFGWPCHVEYMCNVYKWYKTHAVLSPWSPTDYSTMLCEYILQHLLMYYLEYIFLNWLPYWYILLFYFYFTLIYVLPFLLSSLLITSQERGGCYPGLTLGTHIHDWDLRLTRFPIDRSNSIMSIDLSLIHFHLDIYIIVLSSITPSLHSLRGPVDSYI